MNRGLLLSLLLLAAVARPLPVSAQPGAEPVPDSSSHAPDADIDKLNADSRAAFARRDFAAAEEILRRVAERDPRNFVPWYNLACALSAQGKTQDAGPMLEKAIELGFSDLGHMQIDAHLANLRKTENYQRIVANWSDILAAHLEQRLEEARVRYGSSYTYERDDPHRLAYVSAFPPDSFNHAKSEIRRLISWWETYVAPAPAPARAAPRPASDAPLDNAPWVLVVLPTPRDYASWAQTRYGDAWQRVGGVYSHDNKSLIAKDIGSTLRHEFWHVLHWRHMDTLGQRHPIWIMEGLCSLMEDVEASGAGAPRPLPSYRTNQAGQLARTGKLTPWEVLFKLDQGRFVGSRPLAFYAQARSIFMWLYQQGKLKEWYGAYTAGYAEDPSGLRAFEQVFGKPVIEVEKEYKAWLRTLPIVSEDIDVGGATLPFAVDPLGAGDGLAVASSDALERLASRPNARAGRTGGLLPRDVILAIDNRPVREYAELVRLMADYTPGVEVTITYRRRGKTATTRVTLVEKR